MAFDDDLVGQFHQLIRQNLQQLAAGLSGLRIAVFKEHPALGFQQIDAQPFGRDGHLDLILDFLEGRHLLHGLSSFSLICGNWFW